MAGVSFDLVSAQRIYRAVRTVEMGNRDQQPLRFQRVLEPPSRRSGIRVASGSGAWLRGSSQVLSLVNSVLGETVVAQNVLMDLPAGSRQYIIGQDGTAWYLVNWQQDLNYAFTAAELGATTLDFGAVGVGAVGGNDTITVPVSTCATAT